MKALVVFESMFGNNQRIAEAIAQGLSEHMAVEVLEVGTAPTSLADDVALLVVGAPTHMLGMSQPSSRKRAAGQSDRSIVSSGIGVREWLESLNVRPRSTAGAAFDTRLSTRWLRPFPSAAGKIDKGLRKLGIQTMLRPQHFFVRDTRGPLVAGEVERARRWGEELARTLERRAAT